MCEGHAAGVRQAARLLPAALEDTVRTLFHRPPRYVDSVGRPGSRAIMVTPDAWPGVAKMAAADGLALTDIPLAVAARAAASGVVEAEPNRRVPHGEQCHRRGGDHAHCQGS